MEEKRPPIPKAGLSATADSLKPLQAIHFSPCWPVPRSSKNKGELKLEGKGFEMRSACIPQPHIGRSACRLSPFWAPMICISGSLPKTSIQDLGTQSLLIAQNHISWVIFLLKTQPVLSTTLNRALGAPQVVFPSTFLSKAVTFSQRRAFVDVLIVFLHNCSS